MDCRQVSGHELAEKYVSGQLDAELQDQFEVHMLDCPECLSTVETLMSVRNSLAAQADEIRKFSTRPARRFSLVWALAASLLVAGVVAFYFMQSRSHQHADRMATQPPSVLPSQPGMDQTKPTSATNPSVSAKAHPPAQQNSSVAPALHATIPNQQTTKGGEQASVAPQPKPPSDINPRQQKDEAEQAVAKAGGKPRKSSQPISEETAVELYNVGLVDPPAYTFAGFGGSAKSPRNQGNADAVISSGVVTAQGRTLFQQAMAAYIDGHYADAAASLENALRVEPAATDVNFYLGICRIVDGHPADSVPLLKKALAAPPSSLTQSAHFYLAKAYVQMQKLDEAETEMQAAAAIPGRLAAAARALLPRVQALRQSLAGHKPPDSPQ